MLGLLVESVRIAGYFSALGMLERFLGTSRSLLLELVKWVCVVSFAKVKEDAGNCDGRQQAGRFA